MWRAVFHGSWNSFCLSLEDKMHRAPRHRRLGAAPSWCWWLHQQEEQGAPRCLTAPAGTTWAQAFGTCNAHTDSHCVTPEMCWGCRDRNTKYSPLWEVKWTRVTRNLANHLLSYFYCLILFTLLRGLWIFHCPWDAPKDKNNGIFFFS